MSVGNSSFMPSLAVLEPLELAVYVLGLASINTTGGLGYVAPTLLATQVKLEVPRGVFAPQIEFQELHGKKLE